MIGYNNSSLIIWGSFCRCNVSYTKDKIIITLILNLTLNGFFVPYVEELYFRGYLLARMQSSDKYTFVVNTILVARIATPA
jgi:membrane protease YdiL (CAAX protease family)